MGDEDPWCEEGAGISGSGYLPAAWSSALAWRLWDTYCSRNWPAGDIFGLCLIPLTALSSHMSVNLILCRGCSHMLAQANPIWTISLNYGMTLSSVSLAGREKAARDDPEDCACWLKILPASEPGSDRWLASVTRALPVEDTGVFIR